VARAALSQPCISRGAWEWEGAAVSGTVWQNEALTFAASDYPQIDLATRAVRSEVRWGVGPDLGRGGDCGNALDAPALVIGEQAWCEACFIATREAYEQPLVSWADSLTTPFFDE
jgi:hypothetical protein